MGDVPPPSWRRGREKAQAGNENLTEVIWQPVDVPWDWSLSISQICSLVARHWFATQSRFFRYYMQTLSQNLPKGVAGKVCVSTHRVWPFFMKNPQPGKGTWPYWEQWQRLDFSLTYGFCKCWLPKCVFSAGWCVGCSLINHFYYPLVCIKLKKINLEQGSHSFSLI